MYQGIPFNNQFYAQPFQPQMQRMQPQPQMQPEMQYNQPQQIYRHPAGLQGKSVDSIEVVKATDIPLDGSVSYFPIADGSAIVTKQLQADGTSKTVIYKPVEEKAATAGPKYITATEFDEAMKKMNDNTLKEDIKTMKRQIKDLINDIDEIKDRKD